MTPEMYFDIASDERKSSSRESRRLSAVDSTPIASKRFLMVPDDSSAARMPRPGATMASATLLSSARFIATLLHRCAFIDDFAASLRRWQRADRFCRPLCDPEHLDPRQRLALQPLEKGAASGRDISEPPGRAGGIERRDRVTAACHRNNLSGGGEFRRSFGDFDRADVERFELEGAERPVPDQRLDAGEHGADMLDAARADVQDHLLAAHAVHRDHA